MKMMKIRILGGVFLAIIITVLLSMDLWAGLSGWQRRVGDVTVEMGFVPSDFFSLIKGMQGYTDNSPKVRDGATHLLSFVFRDVSNGKSLRLEDVKIKIFDSFDRLVKSDALKPGVDFGTVTYGDYLNLNEGGHYRIELSFKGLDGEQKSADFSIGTPHVKKLDIESMLDRRGTSLSSLNP